VLTEEQKRMCARLGIAEPDPERFEEDVAAMRSGAGVEVQFPERAA
jgi:hypothetical protein